MSEERSKVYEGQSQKESEGKLLQEHFQFLAGMPACINPIFTQYFIPFCPFPGMGGQGYHHAAASDLQARLTGLKRNKKN